jgi:hypothetical protein
MRPLSLGVLALAVLCACGTVTRPGPARPLSVPELKYRLEDGVGRPLVCGPPVVRVLPPAEAASQVAALRARDPATFDAIVRHERLDPANLSADDDRHVLQQAQLLGALDLRPDGSLLRFDFLAARPAPRHVAGTIDQVGTIALERDDGARFPPPGGCPVCLAAADRVATVAGLLHAGALRPGVLVWTRDASGRRLAAPVVRVGHVPAPPGHLVVRLRLADGRSVDASPGHPTVDGRRVGDLRPGDELDGSRVESAARVAYSGDTFDLLPAGPTGTYWANGVPLGSTLRASPYPAVAG